ncbi:MULTISPECIES: tetratricopeptide repeat protein [Rhodoferax]|uniref:Uncharacterized protein n=1 Tax=Rhodoferax fermentans TaxID=28066 RepID=A0A1T1AUB3_RHOFE|nr:MULTISPECIES: tetratricopeptide repeat protein [Rhodoferax]MBK1683875.1 hypothetical protein [Rhodoferax fermentans]OOV07702.1 hypothetical protein RF819_14085 [Rhodoferax fermentans]OOV08797.1 hypothetical protein RF819_20830 [Rhodoferax fermentans]
MLSIFKIYTKLVIVVSIMFAGLAMAQTGPSMSEIYAKAQAGKLDEAQVMVQQVLISHPSSAKAFFVQAELYSRQGQLDRARESLATAEKYAPGLPFIKPEALRTLRAQLAAKPPLKSTSSLPTNFKAQQTQTPAAWLMPLLLTGGVIAAAFFFFRRRKVNTCTQQSALIQQSGLSGPQMFGSGGGVMQPAYPQPGYQPGYPQPHSEPGLGSRIAGGVATGLAVGAGVMAAQAIGRNLMGDQSRSSVQSDSLSDNKFEPIPTNSDMGGTNFGMNDTTWDDGGAGIGSGGEWEN